MRTFPVIGAAAMLAAVWLSIVPALAEPAANGPVGRWRTDNGNLEVEIAPCGPAFCGTVVKVLANRSMSGSGEMAAADARSPLGMTILTDIVSSGGGVWQGQLYNRESDKTYSCRLSFDGPDQLVVRPYVGLPLFGKTLVWARVAAPAGRN